MIRILFGSALALGLLSVFWMGSIFMGSDIAALSVTAVIGGVYLIGVFELLKYRAATYGLAHGLTEAANGVSSLDSFIEKLDATLRAPVKLRIEGERVGLPVPVLTPYLIGLLVMLGLLGTFVGMVDTLQGAVTALEGTTELEAVRAGLAAPIRGLGLAFGTSVAGVATSAMLGLMSTLSKRDRVLEIRRLDAMTATVFRSFSLTHGQRETFSALQLQAQALPEVAEKLGQMASAMTRLGDEIKVSQSTFHSEMASNYEHLATTLSDSLKETISESSRMTATAVSPILADSAKQIEEHLKSHDAERRASELEHFQALTKLGEHSQARMDAAWERSHAAQAATSSELKDSLSDTLHQVRKSLEDSGTQMLKELKDLTASLADQQAQADQARLNSWKTSMEEGELHQRDVIATMTSGLRQHIESLVATQSTHNQGFREDVERLTTAWKSQLDTLQTSTIEGQERLAQGFEDTLQRLMSKVSDSESNRVDSLEQLLSESEALLRARVESESQWSAEHKQRLVEISDAMGVQLSKLRDEEASRAREAVAGLAKLEETFATQVARLGQELEAPLRDMIQVSSEAPKAAAEVITELRAEVSKGIARDNSLMEERLRLTEELDTLSSSLALASTEQKEAIEGLVDASREMLGDVGRQFSDFVGSEVSRVSDVAESFAGSAVEMASLGDAFTTAVELFNDTNEKLMDSLARIEESLENASSRSDEQLGYYVAQAREIIDHSMLSQKEIFEELRQLRRDDDIDLEAN